MDVVSDQVQHTDFLKATDGHRVSKISSLSTWQDNQLAEPGVSCKGRHEGQHEVDGGKAE